MEKFDATEYLNSPELIAAYLSEALKSEDPLAINLAMETADRACQRWGYSRIARLS